MSDAAEVRHRVAELLAGQPLAVLATHAQGQPYTSLVAFAATEDLRHLLFATTRATRKFANLTADERVALLVDNRSNQESDFHDAMAATVMGRAAEVPDGERQALLAIYLGRHPYLRDFVASPTCAFLKVTVEKYVVVNRFQQVMELHVTP